MRAFAALLAVVLAALTDGTTTQRRPAQPQLTVEIQSPLAGAWFAVGESSSIPVRPAAVRAALRVSVAEKLVNQESQQANNSCCACCAARERPRCGGCVTACAPHTLCRYASGWRAATLSPPGTAS